uniref:Vomeronasal type 1 receptor 6 n=1 Tax=Cyprichromis leptosoma TaxID=51791 RepID=I7HHB5_9CICH|nr:vomeronasal type 1 receptor 6 [Cyprichromis leptosoma]
MAELSVNLLGLRLVFSSMGLMGNTILIASIIKINFFHIKSFEIFLFGLAAANLWEIVIINIYDIIILQTPSAATGTWSCYFLEFTTVIGEINSIFFTVLICIFRYQKLRDVNTRVNFPLFLDNIRSAWTVSGISVMLSVLLSVPIFVIDQESKAENVTRNSSMCPPDFFHCTQNHCPVFNHIYKYLFIVSCHLLPLIIVTVTSCLILTVLLSQRKTVTPAVNKTGSSQFSRKSKDTKIQWSTIAVLGAMGLFQVDWTTYLIFQLAFNPYEFLFWSEAQFFITISYTSISPYMYMIGHNMIPPHSCKKG